MIEHETIGSDELRDILRLANQLHSTHDPILRKQCWLQGLCALFRASSGDCVVTHRPSRMAKAVVISSTEYRVPISARSGPGALKQPQASADRMEMAAAPEDEDRTLHSSLQLAERTLRSDLRLFRSPGVSEHFTPADRERFALFHAEMSWLYQSDLLLASADALSLPPRARETLMHLLAGRSEKEIASILGLSKNTVHHYAKLIHKHFDVSSRSELLARWVGK